MYSQKKTKVFGFVGTDHLRTKIITNDETLEQVSQFTYLGCSISYQFSSDAEFKLEKFLQLIGTIKKTIFRRVRTETILKINNTLVLPTFLYGSENSPLTALQRRRIEAAEMKLLRPLAGYTLYDHKTNESVSRELQAECILDEIDEYRRNWLLHLQGMPPNGIPLKSYHYRPQGRRTFGRPKNVGESSCNSGDETDQRVKSLMFMMMMSLGMRYTSTLETRDIYKLLFGSSEVKELQPFRGKR
jgi:hypothetical protein